MKILTELALNVRLLDITGDSVEIPENVAIGAGQCGFVTNVLRTDNHLQRLRALILFLPSNVSRAQYICLYLFVQYEYEYEYS